MKENEFSSLAGKLEIYLIITDMQYNVTPKMSFAVAFLHRPINIYIFFYVLPNLCLDWENITLKKINFEPLEGE